MLLHSTHFSVSGLQRFDPQIIPSFISQFLIPLLAAYVAASIAFRTAGVAEPEDAAGEDVLASPAKFCARAEKAETLNTTAIEKKTAVLNADRLDSVCCNADFRLSVIVSRSIGSACQSGFAHTYPYDKPPPYFTLPYYLLKKCYTFLIFLFDCDTENTDKQNRHILLEK